MKKTLTLAIIIMAGILLLGSVAFANTITIENNTVNGTPGISALNVTVLAHGTNANQNYGYTIEHISQNNVILNGMGEGLLIGNIQKGALSHFNLKISLKPGQKITIAVQGYNNAKLNNTKYGVNPIQIIISENGAMIYNQPAYFYNNTVNFAKTKLALKYDNMMNVSATNTLINIA